MSIYETVKQSVITREAAERYGIKVNRSGIACWPFHKDRHQSMKVDRRCHCFACRPDEDVIGFTQLHYLACPAKKLTENPAKTGIGRTSFRPRRPAVEERADSGEDGEGCSGCAEAQERRGTVRKGGEADEQGADGNDKIFEG